MVGKHLFVAAYKLWFHAGRKPWLPDGYFMHVRLNARDIDVRASLSHEKGFDFALKVRLPSTLAPCFVCQSS